MIPYKHDAMEYVTLRSLSMWEFLYLLLVEVIIISSLQCTE